jgi:hypothetical protein
MKWITRERVKVDRVACPWLIRKFIDPQAEFLFVAPTAYGGRRGRGRDADDVPDVELGHHGDQCSFDAFIEKYRLTDPHSRSCGSSCAAPTRRRATWPSGRIVRHRGRIRGERPGRCRTAEAGVPRTTLYATAASAATDSAS